MDQFEFNQQIQQQQAKQMYLMAANVNLRETFKSCSKICIKQYDSAKLTHKEKVCLNTCFGEKMQSYNQTMSVMGDYAQALKDKRTSPQI